MAVPLSSGFEGRREGRRQRVRDALAGIPPDRPPRGELVITHGFLQANHFKTCLEVVDRLGLDMVVLGEPIGFEGGASGGEGLSPREAAAAGVFVWWLVPGPLSRLLDAHGWVEVSHALLKEPVKAREWLVAAAADTEASARRGVVEGADGVIVADDLAGVGGLMYPPHVLESLYFPSAALLVSRLKGLRSCLEGPRSGREGPRHGSPFALPVLFHSDGDTAPVLQHIFAAGFDGVHGLQPSPATPWFLIRSLFRGRVFWGGMAWEIRAGISAPEEASRVAQASLAIWKGMPGFFFGSVTGLYEGVPFLTVKAAYDAVSA